MTAKELLAEVRALGFDAPLSADVAFISVLNRAIRRIFSERRISSLHSFYCRARIPALRYPCLWHIGGEEELYPARGRVFSCYAHGEGTLALYRGDALIRSFDFSGDGYRIVAPMGGATGFRLLGERSFYITDLVTYNDLSAEDKNIPDGSPSVKYKAGELTSDFLAFLGFPTNERGEPIEGALCVSDHIYIPATYEGRVVFRYLRRPITVTDADINRELDLPEDCIEPIALLVASYLYLDGAPQLAQKYAELYREAMDRTPAPRGISCGGGYRDTNGWA